jgi:WD40 repeat protein
MIQTATSSPVQATTSELSTRIVLCALADPITPRRTIRIWTLGGDVLAVLQGHNSFIYSLISIPTESGGGLASSGEDGIIKIWNDEDGEEDQEILVPALSVWSLTTLGNGDLACGCSDNLIWIFTRDEARSADAATTADYEARLASRAK